MLRQYQAKVSSINIGKVQQRNNINFRVLAYTLHLDFVSTDDDGNPCGWVKQVLDEGLYTNASGKLVPCTDDMGAPVRAPVLLNGSGAQVSNPSYSDAVYRPFHIYDEVDFSQLPMT